MRPKKEAKPHCCPAQQDKEELGLLIKEGEEELNSASVVSETFKIQEGSVSSARDQPQRSALTCSSRERAGVACVANCWLLERVCLHGVAQHTKD